MTDVLLTYAWVRSSYAAMRNLTDHGIEVWAADENRVGMCQWSRRKTGFSRYVSHYQNESAFIENIASLCYERDIRLVLASHNETEILARHRAALPRDTAALLPLYDHCLLFNNKKRAYELACSIGVPVPMRIDYAEVKEVAERIGDAGLKRVVVKLLTGNSAKGVYYADSPRQAQELVSSLVTRYELGVDRYPQIEEHVEGDGVGCSVLYWNGQPIADFGHHRLREKIVTGGTSTLRETFQNAEIRDATHRLFAGIGWHGLAMAEYKYCPLSGKFWFIEVNPRMWGSIALAISSGVEFPYLGWLCATQGPQAALEYHEHAQIRHPWRCRWLLGDLILAASQTAHLDLRGAWRTLATSDADATDDFHIDDPFSLLGEAAYYGTRFLATGSANPEAKGMVG